MILIVIINKVNLFPDKSNGRMSDDEFERLCRSIETAVDSPLALLEAESPSDQEVRETESPPDDSILEEADSPQDNTVLENSSASLGRF